MGTAGDWLDKTIFLWELLVGALTDPLMKATLAMILSPKSEGTSTTPVPLPDPPVAFQMLVLLPEFFAHLPTHPTIQTFDLMTICDCLCWQRTTSNSADDLSANHNVRRFLASALRSLGSWHDEPERRVLQAVLAIGSAMWILTRLLLS